jgi:hypothetical protein
MTFTRYGGPDGIMGNILGSQRGLDEIKAGVGGHGKDAGALATSQGFGFASNSESSVILDFLLASASVTRLL